MNLAGFRAVCDDGWRRVKGTPGFLSEGEACFLMLAAAAAPADGAIVEIGSFKGRSTVGLAYVARRYGLGSVVAIDPHTSRSATDPDLGAGSSCYRVPGESPPGRRGGCRRLPSGVVPGSGARLESADPAPLDRRRSPVRSREAGPRAVSPVPRARRGRRDARCAGDAAGAAACGRGR